MKTTLYSIRDKKHNFSYPSCDINDNTAMRNFALQCSLPDSMLGFAPGDFDLYALGEFDSTNGQISLFTVPEFVGSANDAINMYGGH